MADALIALVPPGFALAHFAGPAAMVFVAALLQGIGGMGFAMVSAPLAVLFYPELVPGPLLVLGAGLALLGLIRERREVDWTGASTLMGGRVVGTLVAGATLSILPVTLFSTVFALLILTGVAFSLSGWRVAPSVPNMLFAGFASGLMGTITSSGAPPFAIVMQSLPPPRLRATMGVVFFLGALVSLAMLGVVGLFGWRETWLGLLLFPFMILGFAVSSPLTRLFSRDAVRLVLLALAGFGAVGILARVWLVPG
ncbi:sulfite exporter TauE/SafE family protein [Prosthecomicrobium pneumaticum]|uniref:Probable membrane transporter protein n=1 Tax=Prosthecomicrobium pneumaticum TaxID=81895 RepID=A0A7W9FR94_9HYPH|nr:sulfite exporter TauE/SafE family protein [Prosthecomicrobium pneumaticum]MBB5755296.1 hypothetical protein [Prosthecomicrobium pneumaticum]